MNQITQWAAFILVLALSLTCVGCGCDAEDPAVIVTNKTAGALDVLIVTSADAELRVNNLPIGSESSSVRIPRGTTALEFRMHDSTSLSYSLGAQDCYDYEFMVWDGGLQVEEIER